uniref:LRAT domain-containing protein n=1 Tax=Amphimedon queenslandica TaxID=400682 RepID=A0A1X7TI38_AMPQE
METPDETSRLDYYGAFSHAIDVKDLKPGDHIYCHRSALFFYSHHGIYVGEPDCRLDLAAQLYQLVRNVFTEWKMEPTCQTAEEALEKYEVEDDSAIRVGVMSHAIDKEHLKPGDQVYCYRNIYTHHGIYIGEPDFAYGCSGTKQFFAAAMISTHCIKAMPPSETVKLAKHFRDHPEEWEEYHLKHNNSETFACFCKTGLLDIAAQFYQFERSMFTEKDKEPCKTFEKALEKYREKP